MKEKMSLNSRRELVVNVRLKYKVASWSDKNKILDGFIAATGYQRKYAISLLNRTDNSKQKARKSKPRPPYYDQDVKNALEAIWQVANRICSKRLVPFIPELIKTLEHHGHLSITTKVRQKLLSVSAATVDRLLKPERQTERKNIGHTKPGALLKKQIQVRTFSDWDDVIPGFLEGDLVAHCGGDVSGSFLNTFVLTDIATGWTEFIPLLCKSSDNVITGMRAIAKLIPFLLLGLDTDNGSEFINYELLDFCQENEITFTRSRVRKSNDQAHVEEKNGSIVRRRFCRKDGNLRISTLVSPCFEPILIFKISSNCKFATEPLLWNAIHIDHLIFPIYHSFPDNLIYLIPSRLKLEHPSGRSPIS